MFKFISNVLPSGEDALETYDHQLSLTNAVKEARIMVKFASIHKQKTDSTVITALNAMHEDLMSLHSAGGQDVPSADVEADFWHAYESLASAISPATVESIMMTRGLSEEFSGDTTIKSTVGRHVRFYRRFAIMTFFALLFIQMFWFIGNQLIHDVNVTEQKIITLKNKISAAQYAKEKDYESIKINRFPTWVFFAPGSTQIEKKDHAIERIDAKAEQTMTPLAEKFDAQIDYRVAAYINLKKWDEVWSKLAFFTTFSFEESDFKSFIPEQQNRIYYKSAKSALMALSNLLLPLFFALLGSVVYILRSLSHHIEHNNLSSSLLVRMPSRLILGMIAGVAMSWLIMPGSVPNSPVNGDLTQALGLLNSLGPWLTAFISGYGVEIFFSLLDTVINSFTKEQATPEKT